MKIKEEICFFIVFWDFETIQVWEKVCSACRMVVDRFGSNAEKAVVGTPPFVDFYSFVVVQGHVS